MLFCNDVLIEDEKFQRLVRAQVAVEQANGKVISTRCSFVVAQYHEMLEEDGVFLPSSESRAVMATPHRPSSYEEDVRFEAPTFNPYMVSFGTHRHPALEV